MLINTLILALRQTGALDDSDLCPGEAHWQREGTPYVLAIRK